MKPLNKPVHTPGPWRVIKAGSQPWQILRPDGIALAYIHGPDYREDEANARLIAAAPELLEALNAALLCIDDEANIYAPEMCDAKRVAEARERHSEGGTLYYYATTISKARAAIAKARGE